MTLPPGSRFSIVRNNVEVPLVPIDQLPFQLEGFPCELTPRQSDEEGWNLVGGTQELAIPFSIRVPTDFRPYRPALSEKTTNLPPDHYVHSSSVTVAREQMSEGFPLSSVIEAGQAVGRSRSTSSSANTIASIYPRDVQRLTYRTPNPSGIEPDSSKKEYCTHWISRGQCDFVQQGCRYKHEMPDREKLRELGFPHGTPKWYREKTAMSIGGSNWLRPRRALDNERPLSNEPTATHASRLSSLVNRRAQTCNSELPRSPDPHIVQTSAKVGILIDLDEPSIVAPSSKSFKSVSPISSLNSRDIDGALSSPPSEQLSRTMASVLRGRAITKINIPISEANRDILPIHDSCTISDIKSYTNKRSGPAVQTEARMSGSWLTSSPSPSVTTRIEGDYVAPSSRSLVQTMTTNVDITQKAANGDKKAAEAKTEVRPTNSASRSTRQSKPRPKRGLRPRKPTERYGAPDHQDGLARSTGSTLRGADAPSKGGKRRGAQDNGMDLKPENMHRPRAIHETEGLRKGANAASSLSRIV